MIGEKIVYAILFLAEAVTAWLYASYIYTAKRSPIYTFISFTLGYLLLFVVAQYGAVMINIGMFFVVNTIILGLNFSCKIKSAVLHAAFLTLIVGISEILVNLLITYITDDYTAYMDSFSAFVSLVVFSKLLYFFITVVAARLFKPHKGVNEEPNQILLLCVMPFVSVIVIAAFVYIGMTGQLVGLAEILAAISSFALLLVNIAAQTVNAKGIHPEFVEFEKIARKYNPVNFGDMRTGNDYNVGPEMIGHPYYDNSIVHAVYTDEETVAAVLKELTEANLKLSIVVSGLLEQVAECCHKAGIGPHTVEYSMGIWGQTQRLPEEAVLSISTMCGHGMISFSLIKELANKVERGIITPKRAAEKLAGLCHCGVFNPDRAARIFEKMSV